MEDRTMCPTERRNIAAAANCCPQYRDNDRTSGHAAGCLAGALRSYFSVQVKQPF